MSYIPEIPPAARIIGDGDPRKIKIKDRLYEGQRRMRAAARPGHRINGRYHSAYDNGRERSPGDGRGHQGHSI